MTRSEHDANEWLAMQQNGRFIAKPRTHKPKASWGELVACVLWNVALYGGAAAIGVMLAWRF